ncbi:MAG TPA: histidine kinase dimerization/phospho-acceptor domain-containing protein [Chryseosolibacter sp.]
MKTNKTDITGHLISSDYILDNINFLFPDSIFLGNDLTILGLSLSVSEELGFTASELKGKPVSFLVEGDGFSTILVKALRNGIFNDEIVSLRKKTGGNIKYSISGFYLGLLTDSSDGIVLRLANREQVDAVEAKLKQTKRLIDDFIYRTAHDLRGPLATMQGLVNLLKIRKDDNEVDTFLHIIDSHASLLADRLNQLVYVAAAEESIGDPTFELRTDVLETEIRRVIERQGLIDFLDFIIGSESSCISGYNEIQVMSAVTNLVLYILSLPRNSSTNLIKIDFNDNFRMLVITMRFEGFEFDSTLERKLTEIYTARYIDLLQSSKFTYLYAAQKVAVQMKALITVDGTSQGAQQLSVLIPKDRSVFQAQETTGLINKSLS